jgi:hypothetical protein
VKRQITWVLPSAAAARRGDIASPPRASQALGKGAGSSTPIHNLKYDLILWITKYNDQAGHGHCVGATGNSKCSSNNTHPRRLSATQTPSSFKMGRAVSPSGGVASNRTSGLAGYASTDPL